MPNDEQWALPILRLVRRQLPGAVRPPPTNGNIEKMTQTEVLERELTGIEATFDEDEILASKTDTKGRLTYANDAFCRVAGYSYDQLHGKPHNIIRHPDMPRAVFNLMWDYLKADNEFFGVVINSCADGSHYWVLAHVVSDIDPVTSEVRGYHSTRRWIPDALKEASAALYRQMCDAEAGVARGQQIEAGSAVLKGVLEDAGMSYDEWIFDQIAKAEEAR